jgi:hypothetical protein
MTGEIHVHLLLILSSKGGDEQTHGTLFVESRFPQSVMEELKSRGHLIKELGDWGKNNRNTCIE